MCDEMSTCDGRSSCCSCDAGQQFGIVGELGDVLERESSGAFSCSGNDQRRDLDNLTLASSGGAGVVLCPDELLERGSRVAVVGCHYCEEGVLDRVHGGRVRHGAEERLFPY
jgi:hypothetical protein